MSADYAYNDKGLKFTSTGKNGGWGGNSNGNGYPFIVHNGKFYGTTQGMGHSSFVIKDILTNTKFKNYNKRQMKTELSINNRNVSICGRLFPHINTDGSSVLTFYNTDDIHGLFQNKKRLGALLKLVGDYFKINPSTILYHIGNSKEQYKCNYNATDEDIKELLNYTILSARNSEQQSIDNDENNFKSVDSTIFDTYAKKSYKELTPQEKEMFNKLRNRNDIKNHLQNINPNFTDAQWNNMRTIGDSIEYTKKIKITEEQYKYIINCKDILKEDVYINNLNNKNKTASLTYNSDHSSKINRGNKTSADMLKTDKMDENNTDTYIVPLKGGINSFNITSINGTEVMHYFKEQNAFIEINDITYKLNMENREVDAFMKQFVKKVENVTKWQLKEFSKKNKDIKYTTISIYPVPSHSNFNKTMANTLQGMSIGGMNIQVINEAILRKDTTNLQRDEDFIEKNKDYYAQLQTVNNPERGTHIQNMNNTMNKLQAWQKTEIEIKNANNLAYEVFKQYLNITNKRGRKSSESIMNLRKSYDEYVQSRKKIRKLSVWFDEINDKNHKQTITSLTTSNNIDPNIDNQTLTENIINILIQYGYGKGLYGRNVETLEGMTFNNFQIKKMTNDTRMGLKNYFQKNDKYDNIEKEIEKAKGTLIIIFDDNVSGGATLGDICYQLNNMGLYSLVPITFGKMRESWNISQFIQIDKPKNGWNY